MLGQEQYSVLDGTFESEGHMLVGLFAANGAVSISADRRILQFLDHLIIKNLCFL